MKGSIAIGIIGTGGIARTHGRGIREQSPSLRLVSASDPDPGARGRFGSLFPDVKLYDDYRKMVDANDLDAVLVAVPHDLHLPICHEVLERGLHVLVEKPIARTTEEADAIIDAARTANRVLMVGHNQRYAKEYRAIREIIDSRRLGRLLSITIDHHQNFDRPPGHWWRSRETVGGGCVIGSGIHRLDLLNWYLGEPAQVFAYAIEEPSRLEAEAVCGALITYASGAVAQFYCNWAVAKPPASRTAGGEGISVFGTDGSLYLEDRDTLLLAVRDSPKGDIEWERIETSSTGAAVATGTADGSPEGGDTDSVGSSMWQHFADCILDGRTPLTDGPTARKALELVLAIYRSADRGEPVDLPLGT